MIPNKSAAPEAVYFHAGQNQSGWGEINLFNKLFVTFFSFSPVFVVHLLRNDLDYL